MHAWISTFLSLFRRQPPRPTARELAEANEFRMKNAKEAAARERQRLIVEWLQRRAREILDAAPEAPGAIITCASLQAVAEQIEDGEPLRAPRREGRPGDPRSRR